MRSIEEAMRTKLGTDMLEAYDRFEEAGKAATPQEALRLAQRARGLLVEVLAMTPRAWVDDRDNVEGCLREVDYLLASLKEGAPCAT